MKCREDILHMKKNTNLLRSVHDKLITTMNNKVTVLELSPQLVEKKEIDF